MGQIVAGVVAAAVLSALLELWRRHHRDKARPEERLLVGLLAVAGGVVLMCLVVFVMPAVLASDRMDTLGLFLKLVIFVVGSVLVLAGVRLVIAALDTRRTPRE